MISHAGAEARLVDTVSSLLSEIRDMVSGPPAVPEARSKIFAGDTAEAARDAAVAWLRDFDAHGPLRIRSITTEPHGSHFVAIVAFQSW
jgi:hypothetical protein